MRLATVLGGAVAVLLCFAGVVWFNSIARSMPRDEAPGPVDPSRNPSHGTDPFADENPDPPPRAEFEEMEFDFGRMAIGESNTHTFLLHNTGEGVLKVAQGPTTCKCTVGKLGEDQVPPGGTTEIELEWHTKAMSSIFSQQATIFTNDPLNRQLDLRVHGVVVPWATTFPNSTWRSSAVSEVEPTPFEFIVVSQLVDSFQITGITTTSDLIKIGMDDITPVPAEELRQYELALCAYRLDGRLALGFPVGAIRERLTVSTDIPQTPQLQLSIESRRIGPYQIIGPGWQGGIKLLHMGRFAAAEGKSERLSFFAETGGDDFQFTGVKVEPPVLDISWEDDPEFDSKTRKRIYITVSTLPDMTPARWVQEDPIHVTLSTDDPDVPEWDFSIALEAY